MHEASYTQHAVKELEEGCHQPQSSQPAFEASGYVCVPFNLKHILLPLFHEAYAAWKFPISKSSFSVQSESCKVHSVVKHSPRGVQARSIN